MDPIPILRLEGAGLAAVATAAYFSIGGPLWLFVVLGLAPDISILAYLAGPRAGSSCYNAAHTYLAPVTLGALGVGVGVTSVTLVALIWAAHIGLDRVAGYGLKYPTGFDHTHLSVEADHDTPTVGPGHAAPEVAGTGDD